MQLQGKHVVLTGATGGIGRAIAERLDAQGARLLLVARNEARLNELRGFLGGDPHSIVVADLGETAGRSRLLQACREFAPDGIDLLINNAGVNEFGLFEEMAAEAITRLVSLNLLGPIMICQDLLPLLQQRETAQIINVGSTFGSIGYPGFSAYCASKFGLRGFTEALRRELADSGVQVSYFAPRATRTDLNTESINAMNDALGTAMDKPELVADELLRIIGPRPGKDKYLGWPEKLFVRINALLPAVVDNSLKKQLPVIRQFAKQEN